MADDVNDAAADLDDQTPTLAINCAPLLTRVITVEARDGQTYRLRDDVPTARLLWGFHVMDLSQRVVAAQTWEEHEAALDERDQERLNLATTIVRHSYPALRRADVANLFTGEQMEELFGYFFTNRLLPLLEQRIASVRTNAVEAEESGEATPVRKTTAKAATVAVTRSRKR